MTEQPPSASSPFDYFVLLEWTGGRVSKIRDFLFAGYAMDDAEHSLL